MTQRTAPGWYRDPAGAPIDRWWDGRQWTPFTQPAGMADYQRAVLRSSRATGTLARIILWALAAAAGIVVLVFIAAFISVATR
jgi:hypothetical protein